MRITAVTAVLLSFLLFCWTEGYALIEITKKGSVVQESEVPGVVCKTAGPMVAIDLPETSLRDLVGFLESLNVAVDITNLDKDDLNRKVTLVRFRGSLCELASRLSRDLGVGVRYDGQTFLLSSYVLVSFQLPFPAGSSASFVRMNESYAGYEGTYVSGTSSSGVNTDSSMSSGSSGAASVSSGAGTGLVMEHSVRSNFIKDLVNVLYTILGGPAGSAVSESGDQQMPAGFQQQMGTEASAPTSTGSGSTGTEYFQAREGQFWFDESSALLFVHARPAKVKKVREYVSRIIDNYRKTIKVEVLILDIKEKDNSYYASDWKATLRTVLRTGMRWEGGGFPLGGYRVGASGSGGLPDVNGELPSGYSYDYSFRSEDYPDLESLIIRALRDRVNVKILDKVTLYITNGFAAGVSKGITREYVASYDQFMSNQGTVSTGLSKSNILSGMRFWVTGHVADDKNSKVVLTVFSDISQLVSLEEFKSGDTAVQNPTVIQKRHLISANVPNGATVALMALESSVKGTVQRGVPGLSSIPLLGKLFSARASYDSRSNIVILLTPRIVDDTAPLI